MAPSHSGMAARVTENRIGRRIGRQGSLAANDVTSGAVRATSHSRVSAIRVLVVLFLASLSVATLAGSVVPARDGLHGTDAMLESQLAENERLEQRIAELASEEQALKTQPWLTQRILRESFRFTDPGEVTIR